MLLLEVGGAVPAVPIGPLLLCRLLRSNAAIIVGPIIACMLRLGLCLFPSLTLLLPRWHLFVSLLMIPKI